MAYIGFSKNEVIEYIPKYGGNRDSENPLTLGLKHIPYARVQHYAGTYARDVKRFKDQEDKLVDATTKMTLDVLKEVIHDIKNCFVDGGKTEIKTVEAFFEIGEKGLFDEITKTAESREKLTAEQIKNSKGASDINPLSPTKTAGVPSNATPVPPPTESKGTA